MLDLSRTAYGYKPCKKDDSELEAAIRLASSKHPAWGYKKIYAYLRNNGAKWNHKRVHRVYKNLGLNLRSKKRKKIIVQEKHPLLLPDKRNVEWAMDFVHDVLQSRRAIRALTIIDHYSREALGITIDFSLPARRVIQALDEVIEVHGKPDCIRMDNGPEFRAKVLQEWAASKGIKLCYIEPGKPVQNGVAERFNRTYRNEVLDYYIFNSLEQAQAITQKWLKIYNSERPHSSLGNKSPHDFLRLNGHSENSILSLY